MADYQLIGDSFAYHAGYPPNSSQQNAALGASQPGQPGLGMLPGSVPPGQQSYHPLQAPRPGYPQTDPLMSHKMHPGYPGYPGAVPPSAAATSSAIRSQYSQSYMPHASMDSYASLSMGQPPPHLSAAGQSLGAAYGQHQNLMGQYPGQRMHTPSPLHATPRHPSMPSQYASTYGSSSQTAPSYHSSGSSELWSSGQNISLQQTPFSSFQSTAAGPPSSAPSSSSLHSSRTAGQFAPGADPYGTSSSNPYFSNHLSTDSPYPPGYPSVSSTQSQSTSSRSSASSRSQQQQQQQQQQQYSSQLGPYSATPASSISAQAGSQTATNSVSSNSAARFSHYSAYPQSMPFDPSSQARLSPYPTPTPNSGGSQTPNSPQYRSTGGYPQGGSTPASQLPVLSPRRPTATPPAGSPMPPTSHTPGPPSVGSNHSTQGTTPGSAFSIATPGSGHHLSNSSSSTAPSSLQQLEQMVMPHLGSSSSSNSSAAATSKSLATSASNSTSTFFPGANANSSPISPQSQQSQQSKLFPSHFAASSPSTQSPQYPYHQYSQQAPPPGNTVQWQPATGQMSSASSQLNTHPLKPSAMIQPPHHGASHSASAKSHQASESALHQPYSTYGSSSKASNDLTSAPDSGESYSQSFASSSNSHSSPSTSSISVSHSTLPQSGYNNISNSLPSNSGLSSYESLTTPKQQSSLKNDTQQLFDPSKGSRSVLEPLPGDPMNPMAGQQSQMTSLNSNSYHTMMQQSYSSQAMSAYSSQSRFDHPMSNQYGGMSSELTNSAYDHSGPDSSMMSYDPYNIDNALSMAPPHQSMSEYRESQANMQQSGNDYAQNDPYAANFDDFETTSKRKGKGRPKKDASAAPAVKKERKPRQPRAPSTRGAGRGRGRGAKNVAERVPIPGMMPDFSDSPVVPYGAPPLGPPGPESLDMYSSSVDMYSPLAGGKMAVPVSMPMEPSMMTSQNSLNPTVLSSQPPPSADLSSPYGPPPSQPPPPQPPAPSQLLSNSLPPPPMAPLQPPVSSPFEQQQMPPSMPEPTSYPSFVPDSISSEPSAPPAPICDNKELSQENKPAAPPNYDDRYLPPPPSADTPVNNANDTLLTGNLVNAESNIVPSMSGAAAAVSAPNNADVDMIDVDKSQMSFNSSMETNCSSLAQPTSVQPPPLPPASSAAPCMPSTLPQESSTYSSNSMQDNNVGNLEPAPIEVSELANEKAVVVPSSFGDVSSMQSMVSVPPPSHLMPPIPPSISQIPPPTDYNSVPYYVPEDPSISQMHSFAASTPIVDAKAKKPKKRRSKKDDSIVEDEASAIKDDSASEKPKKKRAKKVKAAPAVMDDSLGIDNSSVFSSLELTDDKTQLSTFDSTISSEIDTPKPKARGKKKAAKKVIKSEPIESDVNVTEDITAAADLNGDASLEVAEEKPKKPKVKSKSPKKKMPKLALKLKQNKKRRRGFGSPDNSDIERTPPPSPSPEDDSNKRRSARNTKRQRYNDDLDLDLSDDDFMDKKKNEDSNVVNVQLTEDTMVVEKILTSRMAKRELEIEPCDDQKENGANVPEEPVFIDVEEFYVKYKNLSYLHCDWKTEDELEKGDRRIAQKIKRYKQKKDVNVFDFLDEEPFNPDYVEVDRVLDVNEIEEIVDDDEEEEAEEMKPNAKDENKSLADVKPKTESEEGNSELNENGKSDNEIADADRESESAKVKEDGGEATEEAKPETTDKSDIKEEDNVEVDTKTKTEEVAAAPAKEKKKKTRIVRHFLVKWRGLSYEESTWELEDDIDPAKIDHFYKFRNPPPRNEWKIKKRPKASEWKKKDESTVYKNGNTLREYQLEGVNWLSFCWHNGQNCILADEMGLGKTIQSITFVQEMVDYGIPYPYLIIVPLSTIGNWQREFETWTDLNVVTYHGSSPSRNMLQEYELYYKNEKNERIPNVYKFQVMITTFEVILSDCLELSQIKWVACIIDEAHRLKNRNCKLLEGLRMLSIDHRVLLSGTPLQNNVEELYSLLHFLEPSQFASNENFLTEFGDLKTEAQVDKLKAILKPMMLRRLKEDVEKSLAPKEETIIEVELTNVQKKYYRAILERNFAFLSKGGTYANMPNLMNTVMELRKCCIHPFLINGAEEQILQEYKQQHNDDGTISAIIQASGKLVLIDKLLPRLKENGHRVLIFSQMVRCLDILEDYLCQRRYPYERIDGRVRGNLRQAAIDRFSKPDSDRFVFLLCTRAGGLGINLTAADTVIIFDSDWNPQNDLQAQARCHRIGQKKSVKVYRLICRNTYEREMFDRASLKLGLDKAVLQSINAQRSNLPDNQLSKKEIEDLLRKGAYGALMDDDNAGDKFCEEDIDIILQRRTTKIIIESEGKGGSFSKASFATSDNRTDIEIDDPNFWEKWAKKANFDIDELKNRNELIVQEPRRRTQTKRFGADDAMLDITDLETSTDDEEAISMRTRGSRNRPLIGGKSKKRKGRGNYDPDNDEDYAQEVGFGWSRYEFFRVEKALLTYGWGRWDECLKMANFKRELHEQDVEDISRIVLLFSLQNYKGDEKVKSYVLELITPPSEKNASASETEAGKSLEANLFNDVGTCGGRRGKKAKVPIKSVGEELETLDWARNEKYNPEVHLPEEYRKHLLRHANKLLLRVRLLTYIKNEIIGDLHDKVISSTHVRDIPIPYCQPDTDPPVGWWDEEADKSLLIGVYKHGYDRFNLMRTDEALCFLSRCGPPDGAALLAELSTEFDEGKTLEEDEPDTPATPATPQVDVILKEERLIKEELHVDGQEVKVKDEKADQTLYLPFPNGPELNNRLRRLATSYQRNFKKEEARIAQKARHQQRIERIEKFEAVMRAKEQKKREQAQKKWSRREEADFYRIVSSFGVDYNRKTETFDWGRFRMYAKLERKLDDTLTEYFKAFYAMCKKVVGRQLTEDDENLPISVDPITEEKANRCLARIDLLSKVREEIIYHPELEERLKLCQPQLDLPDWWICGKHDRDLLLGVAKYGFFRLDFNLMNDPELSFMEVIRNYDNPTPLEVVPPEKKSPVDVVECEVKSIVSSLIEQVDSLSQSSLAESSDDTDKKEREGTDEKSEETKMEVDEAIDEDKQKDSAETSSDEKAAKSDSEQSEAKSEEKLEKLVKGEMEAEEGAEAKPLTNGEHGMGNHEFILKPMESEIGAMHSTALLSQPKGSFKWPRDRVLQLRLENVCVAVEKNEWPSFRGMSSICMQHSTTPSIATADSSPRPSTPCSLSSASQEHTPHPTPDHTPRRESQSPFTGDYNFYSNNSAATINSNLLNSFENDSTRRRRRRRRRFEMENDRNNKLHSLLNAQFEQPATHSAKQQQQQQSSSSSSGQGSKQQYPSSISVNAANNALNSLASSLFAKNAKNQPNSLFNNLPSQFLPLLSNLPPGLRNVLRDTDLFNDEKSASILLGNTLAAAAAASAKSKSTGLDSKGNLSGPPPAHQSSSSRNSLPGLSTLDLTAKFKNASNSVLEKAAAMSTGRSNHPYPAHKPMNKNMLSEKAADVLDLSSMASKYDAKSAMSNLLSQSLKQSIEQKNSAFLAQQQQQQQSLAAGKKKGRTGSRIDALALNLQAKKMMEEVKQVDTATSLVNRSQQLQQQQQAAASASRMAKGFNDKELLAALTNLGGDKRNSMFFDEFSKQAALHSNKAKNQMSASSSASAAAAAAASTAALASMMKKSTADANKSQMSFLDSLKLLTSKNPKDSASFIQKNLKSMLEEHPELLASASNASLTSLLSSPLLGHTSNLASLSSQSPSSLNLDDKKQPPSRTSKRSRAQFDLPNTSMEEPQSKRAMLAASKSPFLDPKNANNFKYLSTLLDGKNEGIEAKIKNLINQQDKSANFKDFKTPVSMSSSAGSSMRTRTSDKRASASSSSTSFANLNASNLLNSLSMAAASASGTPTSKQQQTAASLLANSYANAFGSNANKSSSSNMSNSTASQFANFAGLGNFNPSMLANSFPSMKMFLDAAAAAAAAGVSKSSAASNSNTSSTTTSSSSAASTSTSASSMSSFANLLGGMNPLLNFSNLANLSALGQAATKKDNTGVDFASLFANANSLAANLVGDDKSKSTKTSSASASSSSSNSNSNKGKTGLSPAAAAAMLGSSGLGSSLPFLYSNPNFNPMSLYNPLSLGSFGLSSPFLNNPNLMNGLANFSNVFTSTTSTMSSSSNQASTASSKPRASATRANTKVASSKASASAASGLSLASSLHAGSSSTHTAAANSTTLDSDDESLKSLLGNDDEDDLNGDFESEHVDEPKSSRRSRSSANKPQSTPPKEGKPKRSTTSK